MGNRAVITTPKRKLAIYVHWNGGRDTIEPLLRYCELALSEVMYIKMECGEDYTDMTPETAACVLEKAGELGGADGDTLGALYALIKIAVDNEDVGTAIQSAINLYQLTGDEEIGNLARELIDAVEKASEAGDEGSLFG